LNCKCKKLKQTKRIIKPRKSNILKRPRYTAPPIEVDATGEVLLGSATAGPAGTMIGVGSATIRAFSHVGISGLKKIREKAEETREAEKKSRRT